MNYMKRNYKITEEQASFGTTLRVEMWDEYGFKRTIYERTIELATKRIYDWWEDGKKRKSFDEKLKDAISQCIEIDERAGRDPSLD